MRSANRVWASSSVPREAAAGSETSIQAQPASAIPDRGRALATPRTDRPALTGPSRTALTRAAARDCVVRRPPRDHGRQGQHPSVRRLQAGVQCAARTASRRASGAASSGSGGRGRGPNSVANMGPMLPATRRAHPLWSQRRRRHGPYARARFPTTASAPLIGGHLPPAGINFRSLPRPQKPDATASTRSATNEPPRRGSSRAIQRRPSPARGGRRPCCPDRRRDERAVESLYARYSGPLYSLAYQVTGADRFRPGGRPGGVHRRLEGRHPVRSRAWRPRAVAVQPGPPQGHRTGRREANIRKRTPTWTWSRGRSRRRRPRGLAEPPGDPRPGGHRPAVRTAADRPRAAFFAGLNTSRSLSARHPLGTAKTRIRSALLKLRDALGTSVSDDEDADPTASTTGRWTTERSNS